MGLGRNENNPGAGHQQRPQQQDQIKLRQVIHLKRRLVPIPSRRERQPKHAGIQYQHVDLAMRGANCPGEISDAFEWRQVERQGGAEGARRAFLGAHALYGVLGRLRVAAGQDDCAAVLGQGACGLKADPGVGASYDCQLARKIASVQNLET